MWPASEKREHANVMSFDWNNNLGVAASKYQIRSIAVVCNEYKYKSIYVVYKTGRLLYVTQ